MLRNWRKNMMKPKIRNLILCLTDACNYCCDYCYAAGEKTGIKNPCCMMGEEVAEKAVKLAAADGNSFFTVQFTGGEPLINFSLIKFVTELVETEKYPAKLQIQTNASLLTRKKAAYFKEHKIGIGISLDGVGEVNDHHRRTVDGGSAFKETVKALDLLAFMKMEVGMTCVITENNIRHLEKLADFIFYRANILKIGFDLLRKCGRGTALKPASPEDVKTYFSLFYKRMDYLKKLTALSPSVTQLESLKSNLKRNIKEDKIFYHCPAMQGEAAVVTPDGFIYVCPSFMGNSEFLIGDVERGLDLEAVERVQKQMYEAMSVCLHCKSFGFCGGGCFARVAGNGGKKAGEECAMQEAGMEYIENIRKQFKR